MEFKSCYEYIVYKYYNTVRVELLYKLLLYTCSINQTDDIKGYTVLHKAVMSSKKKFVQVLCNKKNKGECNDNPYNDSNYICVYS